VHPERQISRSLMAAADAAEEQQQQQQGVGSLSGMHSAPCGDGDDGGVDATCVAKRPGRLQTRPTFSLEDNLCADGCGDLPGGVGNGTIAAARRRRRLLQQGTLASILQADTLWAQGFAGQGVKMGVFDTGIKGDHPDVKHIV
jgi:membrane-bound transcription factor site-1 protease